jgi:hypothetical protein
VLAALLALALGAGGVILLRLIVGRQRLGWGRGVDLRRGRLRLPDVGGHALSRTTKVLD